MKGLLVAATKNEIAVAIKYLHKNKNWNVLITGIGGVSTVYSLLKAIQKYKPDFLLQAGIAGCFSKKISLGTVAVVSSDCFGDLGVIENNERRTLFDLSLMCLNEKPFKNGKLINPHKKILKLNALPMMNAVSVNEITTKKSDENFYKNKLNVAVESMEGAAFHYAALMEKIPFLQIRSISNYVGERNKNKWMMKKAIDNLNEAILNLIPIINTKNLPRKKEKK
jgi:futalosine hydrolase